MMAIGIMIKRMALESLLGSVEMSIKVNTKMTRGMAKEKWNGQMVVLMKVNGEMESNTAGVL